MCLLRLRFDDNIMAHSLHSSLSPVCLYLKCARENNCNNCNFLICDNILYVKSIMVLEAGYIVRIHKEIILSWSLTNTLVCAETDFLVCLLYSCNCHKDKWQSHAWLACESSDFLSVLPDNCTWGTCVSIPYAYYLCVLSMPLLMSFSCHIHHNQKSFPYACFFYGST